MRPKIIHIYSMRQKTADKKLSKIVKNIIPEENTIYRAVCYRYITYNARWDYAYIDRTVPKEVLKEKILPMEINKGGYEFF